MLGKRVDKRRTVQLQQKGERKRERERENTEGFDKKKIYA